MTPAGETESIAIELPWPPSLNDYYQPVNGRLIIKAKGKRYRERVRSMIRGRSPIRGPVKAIIEFYPPDRRRRDLDNLFKCFFDALKYGLFEDDSEIKIIQAKMNEAVPPGGTVYLRIKQCN